MENRTMMLFTFKAVLVMTVAAVTLTPGVMAQPVLPPPPAGVEVTRESGIEFSTIAAPGNRGFEGEPVSGARAGRGSVASSYRMSRTEITTSQYMEFYNTFSTQSDALEGLLRRGGYTPGGWGAVYDPAYPLSAPGERFALDDRFSYSADLPLYGITWRAAAVYCNWLHHDKTLDWSLVQAGAYDTSTFGEDSGGFTDQTTRSPGARFWIPSLDEWIKAAYFTPNDPANPGADKWYQYPMSSDAAPIPGAPGTPGAQTAANYNGFAMGLAPYEIPLGAYPEAQSPWGLLDLSGGNSEFTEEVTYVFERRFGRTLTGGGNFRMYPYDGFPSDLERVARVSNFDPYATPYGSYYSFRVAASVPSPCVILGVASVASTYNLQRRRKK